MPVVVVLLSTDGLQLANSLVLVKLVMEMCGVLGRLAASVGVRNRNSFHADVTLVPTPVWLLKKYVRRKRTTYSEPPTRLVIQIGPPVFTKPIDTGKPRNPEVCSGPLTYWPSTVKPLPGSTSTIMRTASACWTTRFVGAGTVEMLGGGVGRGRAAAAILDCCAKANRAEVVMRQAAASCRVVLSEVFIL